MPRCTLKTLLVTTLVVFSTACGFADQDLEPMKSDRELALLAECREADDVSTMTHKHAVCHTPPGGTREPYTMLLSEEAMQFHLGHGDLAGGCGCEEVEQSASPNAVESGTSASSSDQGDVPTTFCDSNQYTCEHNWGCPESHICDLGCCVYVIAWAESVESDDETTDEDSSETSTDEPSDAADSTDR